MSRTTMEIGEAFIGQGPNAAHVNTVFGAADGPVGIAWATSLATPRSGHVPFVASYQPNVTLRPQTLFVNKAPLASTDHENITWGAAHAGVADGVRRSLLDGVISDEDGENNVLIVAVWVNPLANNEDEVFANNSQATLLALGRGRANEPSATFVKEVTGPASNAFFAAK